ncbi:MAG TPA: hypothetical protein VFE63_18490 [Roseiarcus sp.]|nr:hypothetical protein [Roseiarcus sp.]
MSAFELTRRSALAALVAFAGSPAVAARRAVAPAGPFGGVRVNVAPLLANSGEPTAGWVAQTLLPAISQALASAGRSGAGVAVTIEYVILGPNQGGVGPTGASQDQMIGTVAINGVERPLRASSFYYPSPVDNTMIAQSNYDRVYQLSQAFAYWVARGI